jgi:hypothetical protein
VECRDRHVKTRAEKADADIKPEYYEQIEDLMVKQQAATDKLDGLMSASDDAWEDMKAGVESAWLTLGDAIDRATARIK